jgi:hypothetical protein
MILNKKINTNDSFLFLLLTFSLIFLSHFIMIFFDFNSLSIPIFMVSSVISILFLDEIFKFELNYKSKFFIILFLVIIILSSAHSFLFYSDSKPIKSLLLLPIFLNSIVIFNFFKNFTFAKILNLFKFLFIVSLIFLWVHFFYDTQLFNYSQIAVFPFREASHFALAFGAICVPLIVFTSLRFNLVIMFNLHFFAIYLPNFTFLIFGLISFLIFLFKTNINILLKFSLIIILCIFFFNFNEFIDIDYFISRTPFTDLHSNEQSFSLLIFKQGWEFIYLNLINSNFLGLGFQMMGSEKMHYGEIYYLIINTTKSLYGHNHEDGSFIMSKLLVEFGFIGIIITIIYVSFIVKFLINLNSNLSKIKLRSKSADDDFFKVFFCELIIFSYFVNFFIRGIHYFTPQLIFVFAAVIFLISIKLKHEN